MNDALHFSLIPNHANFFVTGLRFITSLTQTLATRYGGLIGLSVTPRKQKEILRGITVICNQVRWPIFPQILLCVEWDVKPLHHTSLYSQILSVKETNYVQLCTLSNYAEAEDCNLCVKECMHLIA